VNVVDAKKVNGNFIAKYGNFKTAQAAQGDPELPDS
jgi:hypothetical protein